MPVEPHNVVPEAVPNGPLEGFDGGPLMPSLLPWSDASMPALTAHSSEILGVGPSGWHDGWCHEWPDPSQEQRPGFPRTLSLNGLLAVHAPWKDWEAAWAWAHHDWQAGGLLDRRRANVLLQAANAVVHHPLGTLERFEACLNAWVTLEQHNPEAAHNAWQERFWKSTTQEVDDRARNTDPFTAARLRWINHWLDAQTATRRDDPAGLDRAWGWVQRWLDDGRITLAQLVHRRYQVLPTVQPYETAATDQQPWGNGLLLAWRHASAVAMDAWTRWERSWYGPAVVERQWHRAMASLHPDNQRPIQPLGEWPLNQSPPPGIDREAAWIAWGVQRTLNGDPSPTGRTMPIPLYASTASPPRATLDQWMNSPALHPLAIPPEEAPRLLNAARAWERAELVRASRWNKAEPAVRARARL